MMSDNETMQKIIDYYDVNMQQIKRSYTLRNGLKDGMFIEFYKNGTTLLMKEYRQNLIVGKYIEYHENGRLKSCVDYYHGQPHGQQIIYYMNGNIHKIIQYKYGMPHGKWYTYYDNENTIKLKSLEHFLYGKNINKSITYYENGVMKSLTHYSDDGKRNGVCKRFFDTQQLKSSKYYLNDKLNGETVEYYRNGNKKRILYHLEGKLNGTVFKYSNDSLLQFKCHYIENKRDGYSLEYYTTTNQYQPILKRAVRYNEGKKNGKAFLYDEMGNPTYIFEYQNDRFHGIQVSIKNELYERYIMNNTIILEERDSLKECSICYERGNTWRTPCGHFICLDCCNKCYHFNNNNRFRCFYCRSSFQYVNCLPELIF